MKYREFNKLSFVGSHEIDISNKESLVGDMYVILEYSTCFKVINTDFDSETLVINKEYFGNFVKGVNKYCETKKIDIS